MYELTMRFDSKHELIGFLDSTHEPETTISPADETPTTLEDLKVVVMTAASRGKKTEIRAVLDEFGIAKAGECPEDRRTELFEKVRQL